jgi:hypothetical protein
LCAYILLVEATRLKLPPALKKRFDQQFKAGLAEPPNGQAAIALLRYGLALQEDEVSYFGQKTHSRQILMNAQRAAETESSDDYVAQIVALLIDSHTYGQALTLVRKGQQRFPANPFFPYFEAVALMRKDKRRVQTWRVECLLNEAQRRANADSAEPKVQTLLDHIQARRQELAELDPFGAAFNRIIELNDSPDEFDEDESRDEE